MACETSPSPAEVLQVYALQFWRDQRGKNGRSSIPMAGWWRLSGPNCMLPTQRSNRSAVPEPRAELSGAETGPELASFALNARLPRPAQSSHDMPPEERARSAHSESTIDTASGEGSAQDALSVARPPEVGRFDSFVKPTADWFQQRARLIRSSLRPPEFCKACGGA